MRTSCTAIEARIRLWDAVLGKLGKRPIFTV